MGEPKDAASLDRRSVDFAALEGCWRGLGENYWTSMRWRPENPDKSTWRGTITQEWRDAAPDTYTYLLKRGSQTWEFCLQNGRCWIVPPHMSFRKSRFEEKPYAMIFTRASRLQIAILKSYEQEDVFYGRKVQCD